MIKTTAGLCSSPSLYSCLFISLKAPYRNSLVYEKLKFTKQIKNPRKVFHFLGYSIPELVLLTRLNLKSNLLLKCKKSFKIFFIGGATVNTGQLPASLVEPFIGGLLRARRSRNTSVDQNHQQKKNVLLT